MFDKTLPIHNFNAAALETAMAEGIMFLGCPSVRPILVNTISQERIEGIPSSLAQTFTWTEG